jgi:pyrroline-5-carboxylate reductase
MTAPPAYGSVVLVGCGRLGSALVEGWLAAGPVRPADLIILTPSNKPAAQAARARGARVNPPMTDLADARALVLAVKPAAWREALAGPATRLPETALILSVMAGVRAADIAASAAGRSVARVMPTTAVARAEGVAAVWSVDVTARAAAHALFGPLADLIDLEAEDQMDAATAVAGSAPAFIHAFVQALAAAGAAHGLPADSALQLARGALRSAASGVATGEPLDALIARIASPGGTTRAGLDAMAGTGDLARAASSAVEAAVNRAKSL